MALGAVILSLPTAMLFAAYAVVAQGTSVSYGLLLYALVGTAFMTGFTVFYGLFCDDPR